MPSIIDSSLDPAKILLIGKSGAGKTGAQASLVAAGYKLRILDSDKGVRTLRSLLTDARYPYAKQIAANNIDLNDAVRFAPIDMPMGLRPVSVKVGDRTSSETLLAPKNFSAFNKALSMLERWKEGNVDLGGVHSWGPECVLSIDSLSTLAKYAYYWSQGVNARLGARDEGFMYQKDVGAAQSMLTRLLELIYDSNITCNVIVISHITWVDESRGIAGRPQEASKDGGLQVDPPSPDGYPSAIGRALSPQIGKYFNDVYIVRQSGSGASVKREISTVPYDGVTAKASVYLERSYPIATGLADIFAALRGSPRAPGAASPTPSPDATGDTPKA